MNAQQPLASSSKLPYNSHEVQESKTSKLDPSKLAQKESLKSDMESRVDDYLRLHDAIASSNAHLDTLSSFLTTFQTDLSEVSGQISELQGKSKQIDQQVKGRRAIAQPLDSLVRDIIIPPDLIYLIRDTTPGENWIPAIAQLEEKIRTVRSRGKVKASHEVGPIVEGLKTKAIVSIRLFLLSLIRPIRASVRTNIQVVQSTTLLKYRSLFRFLRRQAPKAADEVQRAYVVSARAYYETCFRRYARSLGVIRARSSEGRDLIGNPIASDAAQALLASRLTSRPEGGSNLNAKRPQEKAEEKITRLRYAKIDGEQAILSFYAENKTYIQPVESVFRSLLLVLLDNASSEFTFIVRFFSPIGSSAVPQLPTGSMSRNNSVASLGVLSPQGRAGPLSRKDSVMSMTSVGRSSGLRMETGSDAGGRDSPISQNERELIDSSGELTMETRRQLETIWKQVMETAVEYCQAQFSSIAEPLAPPPAIPLLTMIRLNDTVLLEAGNRGCYPMEGLCMGLKLSLWPIFQKDMDAQIESVKKLADTAVGGGFGSLLSKPVKDATVRQVSERYAEFFSFIVALSEDEEEGMIFTSTTRLRAELNRLISAQSAKIKGAAQQASFLLDVYTAITQGLVTGPGRASHPKLQSELSFFRTREEETRRRT